MDLLEFIYESNKARTLEDLSACFTGFLENLGFKYYKLSDLSPFTVPERNNKLALMSNYPSEWLYQYKAKNYVINDPIYNAAYKRDIPFTWNEIIRQNISREAEKIQIEAEKYFLINGISAPLHYSGGHTYQLNFVSSYKEIRSDKNSRSHCNVAAHQLLFAYNTINNDIFYDEDIYLTSRQKEILYWIAAGKTKSEIANILGVSKSCIKRHCENIFIKLKVNNLASAVAKAAKYGLINL